MVGQKLFKVLHRKGGYFNYWLNSAKQMHWEQKWINVDRDT